MSSVPIVLPSGLAGTVRGLKVHEANLLASAAEQKRGTALDSVYASVWLATGDLGPYADVPGAVDAQSGKVHWPKILVCDRFTLMLKVRIATYGPEYSFKARCSASQCRESFDWELSLDDLPMKPLPALAIEAFKNGNKMSASFPGTGKEFWFNLQTGEGEKRAEVLLKQNRHRSLTAALASRIVEIQGVHGNDKLKFLDDLDMGDANAVLGILDDNDGGVDSDIDVQCPACGEVETVALPFGKEFWVPTRKRATL